MKEELEGVPPTCSACTQLGTQHSSAIERVARQFLRRYGVVFRDLLGRESLNLA